MRVEFDRLQYELSWLSTRDSSAGKSHVQLQIDHEELSDIRHTQQQEELSRKEEVHHIVKSGAIGWISLVSWMEIILYHGSISLNNTSLILI